MSLPQVYEAASVYSRKGDCFAKIARKHTPHVTARYEAVPTHARKGDCFAKIARKDMPAVCRCEVRSSLSPRLKKRLLRKDRSQ
jgi:hypothetical protein